MERVEKSQVNHGESIQIHEKNHGKHEKDCRQTFVGTLYYLHI